MATPRPVGAPRGPRVRAPSVLPGGEDRDGEHAITSVRHGHVGASLLSYLDSVVPRPNVLLSQIQPTHRALAVSQVVLPLAGVNVSRGVAAETPASPLTSGQFRGRAASSTMCCIHTVSPPTPLGCSSPNRLCTMTSCPACNTRHPETAGETVTRTQGIKGLEAKVWTGGAHLAVPLPLSPLARV